MIKEFDCVGMMHKAAEKISQQLAKLSPTEELEFWKKQTEALGKRKKQVIKKGSVVK